MSKLVKGNIYIYTSERLPDEHFLYEYFRNGDRVVLIGLEEYREWPSNPHALVAYVMPVSLMKGVAVDWRRPDRSLINDSDLSAGAWVWPSQLREEAVHFLWRDQ